MSYPPLFIFLTDGNGSTGYLCGLIKRIRLTNRSGTCCGIQIVRISAKSLRRYTESGYQNEREKRFCQRIPKYKAGRWFLVRDASIRCA
jgi:hypothetical protein